MGYHGDGLEMNMNSVFCNVKECIKEIKSRVKILSSNCPDTESDTLHEIKILLLRIEEHWREEIESINEELLYSAEDFVISRLMEKGVLDLSKIECDEEEENCDDGCVISTICSLKHSMAVIEDNIKAKKEDEDEASMEYTDTRSYEIIERLHHLSSRYPGIINSKITEIVDLVEEVDEEWGRCIVDIAHENFQTGGISAVETFKDKGLLNLGDTGCNDDPEVCERCSVNDICPFRRCSLSLF